MLSSDFYGGARFRTLGSNVILQASSERVQCFNPTTTGKTVRLPDARLLRIGGPTLYIVNTGANNLALHYNDDSAFATSFAGESCILCLIDNSTQNGIWFKHG